MSKKKVLAILSVLGCLSLSVGFTFPDNSLPIKNMCISDVGGQTDTATMKNCGEAVVGSVVEGEGYSDDQGVENAEAYDEGTEG